MSLSVFFTLREGNVERLRAEDAAVHLGHGLRGLFRRREADEAESLRSALLVHDPGGGDGSVDGELFAQFFVVDRVIQVLDVQVDALVSEEKEMLNYSKRKSCNSQCLDILCESET